MGIKKHWSVEIIQNGGHVEASASHSREGRKFPYAGMIAPSVKISKKDLDEFETWYRRVFLGMTKRGGKWIKKDLEKHA